MITNEMRTMRTLDQLKALYHQRTTGSRAMYERARQVLPGGAARGATAFSPHPLYGSRANGALLTDIDGNDYVDFNLEGGSCLFGHCSPIVMDRVREQLRISEVQSIASPLEVEVAERVCRMIDCVEMLRFVNSGSEACAIAARICRAHTGRPMIAMCEGHHHGQLDTLLFSHYGPPNGDDSAPATIRDSLGMSPGEDRNVLMLPFNDAAGAAQLIERYADRLAAVFLEPMTIFGGAIPAEPDFVHALRRTTSRHGILLVVDEVPAGIRIGKGGAISHYDVRPDLFITGKALAGGLPIGMYGGRRDILEPLLSPPYDRSNKALSSGTFSGNPTVMSACLAVLEAVEDGSVNARLNALGDHTRSALRDLAANLGVPMYVTGKHSIFGVHFSDVSPRSSRDVRRDNRRLDFAMAMMAQGILWPAGRIAGFLSTAHGEEHIEQLVTACRISAQAVYQSTR
jgi:glutamate-1-semialdehyde 2,1-aminomutase